MTAEWWSIEVFDAELPAAAWRDARQRELVESALTNGASAWEWHEHTWGVVFEVSFPAEEQGESWRNLPGTRAALDAVPDPLNGLVVCRGRGGSSGAPEPRRPRPSPGAAAVELAEPGRDELVDLRGTEVPVEGGPEPRDPGPAVPA